MHLCGWPVVKETFVDRELEKNMEAGLIGRGAWQGVQEQGVHQEPSAVVEDDREDGQETSEQYLDIITQELKCQSD